MTVIGTNIRRVDGAEKVAGQALYAGDLQLPGMACAKVLRSPLPHARIRRIDSTRAAALAGVVAILTRDNLNVAVNSFGAYVRDQQILATDKVRYVGDMIAAVAAVEESIAEEAVKRIDVEYEELPAVYTIEEALSPGAPLVHEKLEGRKDPHYGRGGTHIVHEPSNICFHFRHQRGDVEEGMRSSDFIFQDTFSFPSAQHYPMEPHVSVAQFDGETLSVWTATQSPFPVRQELARIFGLPFSAVRVIVPYVGGGYGAKSGIKTEGIAACLSRITGRPVRLAFSAEETFKTICQPRAKIMIKTGVKKDGTFVARRCEVYLNGGAYANSGPSVTEKAGYRAHGPYRIPHVLTDSYSIYTNTVPAGAFRGFGGNSFTSPAPPQGGSVTYQADGDTVRAHFGARATPNFGAKAGTLSLKGVDMFEAKWTPCGGGGFLVPVNRDGVKKLDDDRIAIATDTVEATNLQVSMLWHDGMSWLCVVSNLR